MATTVDTHPTVTRIIRTTKIKNATRIKMVKTATRAPTPQTVEPECAKAKMDMDLAFIPALMLREDLKPMLFRFITGVVILAASAILQVCDYVAVGVNQDKNH